MTSLFLRKLASYSILFGMVLLCLNCQNNTPQYVNWSSYLGDKNVSQFSPLTEINKENVQQLKVAWTYQTGDADTEKNRTQIQCNPLIIDGVLYGSSARLKFFALDAQTGKNLWTFDPFADQAFKAFGMGNNRGLAHWTDGRENRLLVTAGSFLYALDAQTGQPIADFGEQGKVDLHEGLDRNVEGLFINSNTPGIVYQDKLILGCRVSESGGAGAVPGHIRAYNVKTGEQEWLFHTIPWPGEYGYETWPEGAWQYSGGANAWAGFSLDEERGTVFVPTGSASFDFYGGDRIGENLFANCLLALDANTGKRKWHYQFVHHDIWDRDLPAPPNLIRVKHKGKMVDAVAQITKSSYVFVFDRDTGEPLFPIEEVPVAASELAGEEAWPTQPIPVKPPPFSRNRITEQDLTQRTPEAHAEIKKVFANLHEGASFVPPSEAGSIIFPGLDGGGEWGGAAFEESSGQLIVNASEMPWILRMKKTETVAGQSLGKSTYNAFCLSCHGKDMQGGDMFGAAPSLVDLNQRLDAKAVKITLKNGKGAMPSFGFLSDTQVDALAGFLLKKESTDTKEAGKSAWPYPYYFEGYNKFVDQDGYPAITPPWGTLNAINLNTGEISWKVTLGEYPELAEQGMTETGCESYGGPVVTASGLVFMAGTLDEKFRVFDSQNGDLLFETKLPAAGFATPAVYAIDGKQYIVIACGGGKVGQKSGDSYVAFSL
ncbi:MAG: PQQ-binding-like beta-propeller repeat protein [Bacteroidota bacterium]